MTVSHRAFTALITQGHGYRTFGKSPLRNLADSEQIPPMLGELKGYDPDLLDFVFWMAQVRGLSPNTTRVRLDFLHRLSEFAGVQLRDIEPHHLLKFERVAIAGRSAESRRAYVCHLRAFYRWAMKTGIVQHDPTEVLTLPSVPKHLPRPVEEDDLSRALDAAKPKMAAMIVLAAYAGCRCCEIATLDWGDVRREPDGTAYLRVRGKGDKDRMIEIGVVVIKALQSYGIKRRGPMFLGRDGRQIDPKSVSRSVNRFLTDNGVDATAHQLRHRFGTIAYQLSHDLRMVQDMMGHSSPSTTAGYARPSSAAARRMVAALDALAGYVPPSPRAVPAPDGAGSGVATG